MNLTNCGWKRIQELILILFPILLFFDVMPALADQQVPTSSMPENIVQFDHLTEYSITDDITASVQQETSYTDRNIKALGEPVTATITVLNPDGAPAVNANVKILAKYTWGYSSEIDGITDSSGKWVASISPTIDALGYIVMAQSRDYVDTSGTQLGVVQYRQLDSFADIVMDGLGLQEVDFNIPGMTRESGELWVFLNPDGPGTKALVSVNSSTPFLMFPSGSPTKMKALLQPGVYSFKYVNVNRYAQPAEYNYLLQQADVEISNSQPAAVSFNIDQTSIISLEAAGDFQNLRISIQNEPFNLSLGLPVPQVVSAGNQVGISGSAKLQGTSNNYWSYSFTLDETKLLEAGESYSYSLGGNLALLIDSQQGLSNLHPGDSILFNARAEDSFHNPLTYIAAFPPGGGQPLPVYLQAALVRDNDNVTVDEVQWSYQNAYWGSPNYIVPAELPDGNYRLEFTLDAGPAGVLHYSSVHFPDPNLEAAVRETMVKPIGAVTATDMAGLTSLVADHREISDLSGLESAVNLENLDLGYNQISNIDTLAGLTALQSLNLGRNQISDIAPLAGLTNLRSLFLGANQISDFFPLVDLTSLHALSLGGNQIGNLANIAAVLANKTNLQQLYLWDNQLSDISLLADMTGLREIVLSRNQISDLTPLANLTQLQKLRISNNEISDLTALQSLTDLQQLLIDNNNINDITPLTTLTNLQELNLGDNQITSISPLVQNGGLSAGDYVNLKNNYLDLAPDSQVMADIQLLLDNSVAVDYTPQLQSSGTVSGTVTDAAGNPLSGISVEAGGVDVETNPDGSYTIELPFGTYKVFAPTVDRRGTNDGDWARVKYPSEITIDATHPNAVGIDFVLEQGGSIAGRITDETGAGIPNALVWAEANIGSDNWVTRSRTRTDANGYYILRGLRSDDYIVGVEVEGFSKKYYPGTQSRDNTQVITVNSPENIVDIDCEIVDATPLPGMITTYAGGETGSGPATTLPQQPAGIAISGAYVYIADPYYHVVRRLDTITGLETVVAGNGTKGSSGDNGPAISAQLQYPESLAMDGAGNLYIADSANDRIRKVDPSGLITTVAGNGTQGYSGDNEPATDAQLNWPNSVAIDAAGTLYIADTNNKRIRKVDPSGIISTVAGDGSQGYSGDNGPAISAQFSEPSSVVVDSDGNLYIADRDNHRIRKVDVNGIVTTVAGNGTFGNSGDNGPAINAQMTWPQGVAIDTAGNLYFAGNNRIRKVDPSGIISSVAGNGTRGYSGDNGPATDAQLNWPQDVAIDTAGNLYIADTNNNRIRKLDPSGIISTVAGTGDKWSDNVPATKAYLNWPEGVTVDGTGNLYIAVTYDHRISKVNESGIISTLAGKGTMGYSGDNGPASNAQFEFPRGLAVDGAGNLYIADSGNHRIRKVDPSGIISTVAGNGTKGYTGDGGMATGASLAWPKGVAIDTAGNIYIADTGNHRIRMVDTNGIISTVAGDGTQGYSGDGGLARSANLDNPQSVAIDLTGNLYIADEYNNRIRKVDFDGVISTVAGSNNSGYSGDNGIATDAQLTSPSGVAVDRAGNLYISDSSNRRIRKVDPSGIITTVAGNGTYGYSGDNGPATNAQLSSPRGIAVDEAGNLYITDLGNNRIRLVKLQPEGPTVPENSPVIDTTRITINNSIQANGDSYTPSISANGRYVVFSSDASNLIEGDTNNSRDIFVHDRDTEIAERVSISANGAEANGYSFNGVISGNDRYVVFESLASNLVVNDTNNRRDIFVHDRVTVETVRVSVSSEGLEANDNSFGGNLSYDGRYITFYSDASNLVEGDSNDTRDVFVRDLQTGITNRVSISTDGDEGNDWSWGPSISSDGRYVVFESSANNLVEGNTNNFRDVFVHDQLTGVTAQVSLSSDGVPGNHTSGVPAISSDGRYIAFYSNASNLVENDINDRSDVFVYDQQTGNMELAGGSGSREWNEHPPSISNNNRYVAFHSDPNDSTYNIYVKDLQTGATIVASVSNSGAKGNGWSLWPSISSDGRYVAFGSSASNLVEGDTNSATDIFVATVDWEPQVEVVHFPDPNLEAVVREELAKPEGDITAADMAKLTALEAIDRGINDLTGLEHAVNLATLELNDNPVTDLSPLAGLGNLGTLNLFDNPYLTDFSVLAHLTQLQVLQIRSPSFTDTDLELVASMSDLWLLNLSLVNITDFSPVAQLSKLSYMLIQNASLGDIRLANLVAALEGLTDISLLGLGNNEITDLSPLAALTGLTTLWARRNDIVDLSPLVNLTNLKKLDLKDNQISDISSLIDLKNLQDLYLQNNYLDLNEGSHAWADIQTLITNGVNIDYEPQQQALVNASGVARRAGHTNHEGIIVNLINVDDQNATQTVKTSVSGNFAFSGLEPGSYLLRVSAPGYLFEGRTLEVTTPMPVNLNVIELRPGDLDGNNKVNALDLGLLVHAYRLYQGASGFDVVMDFDGNGIIDLHDLVLITRNFEQEGSVPQLDLTWYFQANGSADFSAHESLLTGTIIGWPESGYQFYFDDHITINSDLVAWWSINSLNPPRGWFYGYNNATQVAQAVGITDIHAITNASIYNYTDWSIGPVEVGAVVLFRLTPDLGTGPYAAFHVDRIYYPNI